MELAFEQFLDDISRAFLLRDLALWRSRVLLPFSFISTRRIVVLATEEKITGNFELYLKAMDAMDIDFVDRMQVGLEDCGDGTWLGTFQTRLLSRQQLTTAPYTSTALMQIVDDRFRMTSMLNARDHYEWTGVEDM